MRWLDSITNSMDMNLIKLWEIIEDQGAWHSTVLGVSKSQSPWIPKSQWDMTEDIHFITVNILIMLLWWWLFSH